MKHYAEYYMPGSFFNEECSRELSDRSVDAAVARAPESAFAFVLYDLPDVPAGTEDYTVVPKRKNVSKRHYLGGKLYNIAEVEALGDHEILLSNMRASASDHPSPEFNNNDLGDLIVALDELYADIYGGHLLSAEARL